MQLDVHYLHMENGNVGIFRGRLKPDYQYVQDDGGMEEK